MKKNKFLNIFSNYVLNEQTKNSYTYGKTVENCVFDSKFIEEHSVIFWNLIWYFKRIGVDSSFLVDIFLNSRIEWLKVQSKNIATETQIELKSYLFVTPFQSKISKPYHFHPHVKLNCMWDNLKLQNLTKDNEIPLYLSWLNSGNCDDELSVGDILFQFVYF